MSAEEGNKIFQMLSSDAFEATIPVNKESILYRAACADYEQLLSYNGFWSEFPTGIFLFSSSLLLVRAGEKVRKLLKIEGIIFKIFILEFTQTHRVPQTHF